MNSNIKPDYIFEVSWEVCNRVGGIYTVLSTKAKTLQEQHNDKVIFIGPDIWQDEACPYFLSTETPLKEWETKMNQTNLKVKVGRWNIPGEPIVILVDFRALWEEKDELYGNMWQWYGVNSLNAYGDYDESCIFSYASALIIESCYSYLKLKNRQTIAHFNEWTVGMGILYLQKNLPAIGTVFTTHATSIGRSIACNNKELYKYFKHYNGDQMASELNMEAKHSLEKATVHHVDCFTTVSEITAGECEQLLEKTPDVVTPNAFEMGFVPKGATFTKKRREARELLIKSASSLIGYTPAEDALLVGIGGRYEYKNKGIDLFIDTLNFMRINKLNQREVIGFIFVPAWVGKYRESLKERMKSKYQFDSPLEKPYLTHHLVNDDQDNVMKHIRSKGFVNNVSDNVKIIFVPVYLTENDGIFNKSYYDLLIGLDLTLFPSYYEPWGYTPMESIAFRVPTITSDLAGFGLWCKEKIDTSNLEESVCVIRRNDDNYFESVNSMANQILMYSDYSTEMVKKTAQKAKALATSASWDNFIKFYDKAYDIALTKASERTGKK